MWLFITSALYYAAASDIVLDKAVAYVICTLFCVLIGTAFFNAAIYNSYFIPMAVWTLSFIMGLLISSALYYVAALSSSCFVILLLITLYYVAKKIENSGLTTVHITAPQIGLLVFSLPLIELSDTQPIACFLFW